ncbi:NAD(+) diphosphatase [Gimibacter soli]|uniref:NAD(+) diphosphatase n=1 Tax=Gimibacter soli TaxID=3024400 RepID=A0AAF0BL13_9PROT|nr:NAD(+) diphosphatase [Gimibacter soli]WCL54914.1 NAD(+) diphosphatase [Gimibacter soli]
MSLAAIQTLYSGNPLDRADQLRGDPALMSDGPKEIGSRFTVMAGDRFLTLDAGGLAWLDYIGIGLYPAEETLFLGIAEDGTKRYAILWPTEAMDADLPLAGLKFRDVRGIGLKAGWPDPELGILAQAKSMLDWHQRHRACAQCGAPTDMVKAGYERQCRGCGASHFPRTDPVVIMLALHGGKALVARNAKMPPGFFSALAGFVEPGETIEEAVARELMEEAGVKATSVRYVASQPWPFPSSLMIGCIADVADDKVTLDMTELVEARWVTKAEAKEGLKGMDPTFMLPPTIAIARDLITAWVKEG